MPFVSKAQQRWGHTAEGEKALGGPSAVKEWDSATNEKSIPQKIHEMKKPLGKNG
jgi:hypothetical protein